VKSVRGRNGGYGQYMGWKINLRNPCDLGRTITVRQSRDSGSGA